MKVIQIHRNPELICCSGAHLVEVGGGGVGVHVVRTFALFRYSSSCALKFLNEFRRKVLKNQVQKMKESIKTIYQKHWFAVFQRYFKKYTKA